MPDAVIPILYATLAAAFFGGQGVLTVKSFAYVGPQTGSMISMGACVIVFWLLAPFMLCADDFRNPGMWIFLANGVIHPLVSMYLAFEATKRMGATISATISAITPLFATAGAVLVLGEHITVGLLTGTLGTVLGIMVLSWRGAGSAKWALSALFFPVGAAIIRAVNQNVAKFGLALLPSPFFASLASFTVSFTGAVLIYRIRVGHLPLKLPRGGLLWSSLSGIAITVGVLCMYSALNSGQVVVVSPIVSIYPLFTLIASLIVRQETLRLRLLIGVILVLGGVVWISVQS